MSDQTYNGWTNRETWLVNLWLSNEQGTADDAHAACNVDGEMLQEAAQSLEDYVRDLLDETEAGAATGFTLDLINAALARVNWAELVDHFRSE
jgi:hypothetical protein